MMPWNPRMKQMTDAQMNRPISTGSLRDGMIAAAAVLHQRSPAEDPDDRLVQKERQSGVQSALEQIEWQDAGDQDADDGLSGHAEIDRRDDIIPQQHAEDSSIRYQRPIR